MVLALHSSYPESVAYIPYHIHQYLIFLQKLEDQKKELDKKTVQLEQELKDNAQKQSNFYADIESVYATNEELLQEKTKLVEQIQTLEQLKTTNANQIMQLNIDLQMTKKDKDQLTLKFKETEDKFQKLQEDLHMSA